jgi:hypothetical protein
MLCRGCVELRLAVPGVCLGGVGKTPTFVDTDPLRCQPSASVRFCNLIWPAKTADDARERGGLFDTDRHVRVAGYLLDRHTFQFPSNARLTVRRGTEPSCSFGNRAASETAKHRCARWEERPYRASTSTDGSVENGVLRGKQCPISTGAISGNQDLKCPYLGEILDVLPKGLAAISAT